MGTNYYMMTTDKEIVKKYFTNEYEIVDFPYLGYEIHIGKRSMGWRPLFQAHKKVYDSVSELLIFLRNHQDKIEIYNEYGEQHTIEQLKVELIDLAEGQEKRIIDYERIGEI